MKALRLILPCAILSALSAAAPAQTPVPVTPATPQSFKFKPTGQTSTAGATIAPAPVPAVKQTTYLTLGRMRQWTNAQGNPRIGQLIAWEQTVVTVPVTSPDAKKTSADATPPPVSGKPTIVRDGKIRLLIDRKPYEVPLDRLAPADQDYIKQFEASLAQKP
ncbi:MAG: hypothetical protein EOP86_10335 [Verrucomicrobiaceae bacterium]|nr:MAG: hypothetical protein EOP86_10335 [Verrucomicrobiaceae bacterium]